MDEDLPRWATWFRRIFLDPQADRAIPRFVRDPWDQVEERAKLDERFTRWVRKIQGNGR